MCSRKKRTKKGAANESLPKGVAQEVPECTEAYAGGPTDWLAGTSRSRLFVRQ